VRYGIDQQILADTVENATNLIRFIKNIGLYNEKRKIEKKKPKEEKHGWNAVNVLVLSGIIVFFNHFHELLLVAPY
jgi:hypothetical protein